MPFLPETAEQDVLLWARQLVTAEAHVLHTELGIVGRVVRVWAPGDYFDESSGKHITRAVLSLDNGNSFVLREDAAEVIFVLTSAEVAVHERLVSDLGIILTGAIVEMNNHTTDKTRLPIALAVLGAALAAQLRSLRSTKG